VPYEIRDDHPDCPDGYAVVKEDTSESLGCHDTQADAQQQLEALYANEADAG
jgi:hypothetical protein